MIKANELRIGNLLQDKNSLLLEVVGLCNFKVLRTPPIVCRALDEDVLKEIGVVPEDARPIPLTEEWLVRFGFLKRKDYPRVWFKNGLSLWYYPERPSVMLHQCKPDEVNYRYVHQLQNLFHAITGEELTIKEGVNK